jgi:hypothetical protein
MNFGGPGGPSGEKRNARATQIVATLNRSDQTNIKQTALRWAI